MGIIEWFVVVSSLLVFAAIIIDSMAGREALEDAAIIVIVPVIMVSAFFGIIFLLWKLTGVV